MSDTLNRRYEAAADSITDFYFTESREHDVALARPVVDAADAAVNIEAAAEALWEDETPVLGLPQPWDKQDEGLKHEYRVAARRTVATALGRDEQ